MDNEQFGIDPFEHKPRLKSMRELLVEADRLGVKTRVGESAQQFAKRIQEARRQADEDIWEDLFEETEYAERIDYELANKHGTEVSPYVDRAMYEAEGMSEGARERPRVTLLSATPDPLGSIAAMSMMYEGKVVRDLADVANSERAHYFEESFKTHLKAPWESVDLHFLVEGVTRAFTHQMVRQRTAVFAQESLRFAVKEEIVARPGPLVAEAKARREVWEGAVEGAWEAYQQLIALGAPAEEARGLLPHDTLTRLHYKTNLRNLADHLGNRLCTQAQFEWRLVAADLKRALEEFGIEAQTHSEEAANQWQFRALADSPIFQPVCFTAGKCPFKADFDRGCTIRGRVDEGRFEEIHMGEWLADPTAAWVR